MLYGGFTTVCVGAISMEAPKELWPDGQPPVSPAVACTMNLSMQYFAVYLAIAVLQTWAQFQGTSMETRKLAAILQLATNTVNFAPMLCILFIGARMRALQLDPKYGNPQAWAQNCFFLCSYSVLVQLLLVLAVPYVLGGNVVEGEAEGDITFELPNPTLFMVFSALRYLLMLALHGGHRVGVPHRGQGRADASGVADDAVRDEPDRAVLLRLSPPLGAADPAPARRDVQRAVLRRPLRHTDPDAGC